MILPQSKLSQGQDYDVVVFQPCSCDVHSCAVADTRGSVRSPGLSCNSNNNQEQDLGISGCVLHCLSASQ